VSLTNFGNQLGDLGRHEEALAATQDAVDLYRRLAQSFPDTFQPDLAHSLHILGIQLRSVGRREESLTATQETVDVRRRLAQSRPDAFEPDLAKSIAGTSIALAALDRNEEAARTAEEALRILLPYVRRYPKIHSTLARALIAHVRQRGDAAGCAVDEPLLEEVARLLSPDEE
jgi:tetratricopeptide (TPR) repeat protein